MTDKVIRDGMVAVLISPGYGAGWSTWNRGDGLFEPLIVEWIENGCPYSEEELEYRLKEKLGVDYFYTWERAADLVIKWLPVGTKFLVQEYDGSEYIITEEDLIHTA
jgi:hypothetical protein